jgi:hypothetical protein
VSYSDDPMVNCVSRRVVECARCGGDHDVVFHRLSRPAGEWLWWGSCPVTKEPVLMQEGLTEAKTLDSLEVMQVPRCDSCRWWKNPYDHNGRAMGACSFAVGIEQPSEGVGGVCHSPGGVLFTSGGFGCVQWEGRL